MPPRSGRAAYVYFRFFMSFDNSKNKYGPPVSDDEERLLLARAAELSQRSERGEAAATSFLTPRQQRLIYDGQTRSGSVDSLFLWGGFKGAERRIAIFLPPWITDGCAAPAGAFSQAREEHFVSLLASCGCEEYLNEFTVPVCLSGSGYASLGHRDWLGSLTALGIKREVLGDIAVESDSSAYVFAKPEAAAFIVKEMKSAGRDRVKAEFAPAGVQICPSRSFEKLVSSVASPRLDGVVRALCGVSREAAAEIVTSGAAELNYLPVQDADRRVCAGDVLSVRGYGKFIIDRCEDETRRGRIRLEARKYI